MDTLTYEATVFWLLVILTAALGGHLMYLALSWPEHRKFKRAERLRLDALAVAEEHRRAAVRLAREADHWRAKYYTARAEAGPRDHMHDGAEETQVVARLPKWADARRAA